MRLAAAILASLIAFTALGEEPLLLRMGTLYLNVPSTWRFEGSGQRAEGKGPAGEGVIVNYRVLKPGAPVDVVDNHWKMIRGFAAEEMPKLASKNGEVVRILTETSLPGGRVEYSSATQTKKMMRDYYFLQYLLGSPRSMIYITVEGYGNALDTAARFEQILATQRWDE